jgi:hypothetical protein
MKFDQDILFEFLPEEDKKSFMVWDNVLLTQKYSSRRKRRYSIPNSVQNIVATYRAPFEERVLIPLDEYELRLKQKERDNKLNDILNDIL